VRHAAIRALPTGAELKPKVPVFKPRASGIYSGCYSTHGRKVEEQTHSFEIGLGDGMPNSVHNQIRQQLSFVVPLPWPMLVDC